jgi:hypothetical protein
LGHLPSRAKAVRLGRPPLSEIEGRARRQSRISRCRPRSGALGEREPGSRSFREACRLAGLPYFNPHSLRNTLVQIAYDRKLDAEAFKAWSQNLGHENCLTTFSSYGTIPPTRQAEIMRRLAADDTFDDVTSQAKCLGSLRTRCRGVDRLGRRRPTTDRLGKVP